jgi:hypothetical protein
MTIIGVSDFDNSSSNRLHPLTQRFAIADAVTLERNVGVRDDVEVVPATVRDRLHGVGGLCHVALVPDRGGKWIGIADQYSVRQRDQGVFHSRLLECNKRELVVRQSWPE